ncbi:hypothetical protein SEA_SEJANUS_78 [Mycobacterium phage Sejanus]|nr:hypothetical protein SEA_SEJANUS_78 [Mycobacterium phage Sejanus]
MPEPINYDDTPCALCDCYGIQHDDPEHGGRCHAILGPRGRCDCPGYEPPFEEEN